MKIIKHICSLVVVSGFCTNLLSCSNKEVNSDLPLSQNTRVSGSNTNQLDVGEFRLNRELWNSQNIENYRMTIGARGLLMKYSTEVLIEVENGHVKSINPTSKTDEASIDPYKRYDTVDKIFGIIEEAKKRKAEKIRVEYDKVLGYPTRVSIDREARIADDEESVEIKDLKAVRKFENQL